MKMKIIGIGVFSLALVLGLWSYSQATGNEITICAKKSGLVYVIGDGFKRADCKKNDQLLTWNVVGIKGDKGDKGDTGSVGLQGLQGIQGLKGDRGDTGLQGIQGEKGAKGDTGDQGLSAQHGAGNIAFMHDNFLLKTDGTVWVTRLTSPQIRTWHDGYDFDNINPNVSPVPIPVNNIVDWQLYFFVDNSGNFWQYDFSGDVWVNSGPLP